MTARLLLISVFALSTLAHAQDLVSTQPEPRTALLEKFTAIHCGNCPAASAVSNQLASQYGEDLVRINIHGGSLATPSGSQPDFRTTDGEALWDQFNVQFQPQGMIDRQGLQGASGWNSSITGVLGEFSPVNIGARSTFDAGSNTITVDVELYYTDDGPVGDDRIHVALTQDHIIGWQTDYVNGNQPSYDHRNVLRELITPLAGDPVTATNVGDLVQRSYSFSLDPSWTLDDLIIVAFVSEAGGIVHQARSVSANGGATVGMEESDRYLGVGDAFPVPANEQVTIGLAPEFSGSVLYIRDLRGRAVVQVPVAANVAVVDVSTHDLAAGVYTYGTPGGAVKRIVVAH